MNAAAASARTPLDLPLDGGGTTFIEASAGTGKTHALTTLVARLVLEEEWSIDRILVVTFTRAATAELRDRIRRVLGVTLAAVRMRVHETGLDAAAPCCDTAAPDPEAVEPGIDPPGPGAARRMGAAGKRGADFVRAARRLEAAMHDIDRANVFTIHGFCQRVLADLAFESGFPFGCEVERGRRRDGGGSGAGLLAPPPVSGLHAPDAPLGRERVPARRPRRLGCRSGARRWARSSSDAIAPAEPIETAETAWREVFEAAAVGVGAARERLCRGDSGWPLAEPPAAIGRRRTSA